MSDAAINIDGNTAVISLPPETPVSVRAKTNSPLQQRITLVQAGNGQQIETFSGSGERATIGGTEIRGQTKIRATFESQTNGQWTKSRVQAGGPYTIGNYNLIVVASESGDDADNNDSILELSWNVRR
nr:fucose-binding lectin II [uncultured Rhodopila sp.]